MARVSDVDFVKAYAKADSADDVVEATGLSKASVQQKASKLRKLGVDLPKFQRATKEVDVAGLNKLLKGLTAKSKK